MSIVSSSAGSNTAAGGTDVFDMTALKAVVAGAGTSAAYQPPMQSKPRSQLNTEHWEGAERDTEVVAAVAAGPTVGASGGGGGGDEDGQNTAGAAARAAAQPSIAPPADEKENMDPLTGRYHGASQAMASPPNRTRARQPFAERQVPQQAAQQRRDIDNQQARDKAAPRRKALGEHLPVKGRDAGKASLMR